MRWQQMADAVRGLVASAWPATLDTKAGTVAAPALRDPEDITSPEEGTSWAEVEVLSGERETIGPRNDPTHKTLVRIRISVYAPAGEGADYVETAASAGAVVLDGLRQQVTGLHVFPPGPPLRMAAPAGWVMRQVVAEAIFFSGVAT